MNPQSSVRIEAKVELDDLSNHHLLLVAIIDRSYRDLILAKKDFESKQAFKVEGRTGRARRNARNKLRYRSGTAKREAREFFESASEEPFSYRWICAHLDVDPDELLKRLDRLTLNHVFNWVEKTI